MEKQTNWQRLVAFTLAEGATHVAMPNWQRLVAFTLAEGATHVGIPNWQRRVAFTLAEVLITLGIIGIVAAMTMPTLLANKTEKETTARLKKVYSTISQAFISASNEFGTPDNWEMDADNDRINSSIKMFEKFKPYLNITRVCLPLEPNCFAHVNYKHLVGTTWQNFANPTDIVTIRFSDGTAMSFEPFFSDSAKNYGNTPMLQNVYGSFFIDVNGDRKPNVLGRDVFSFYLTKFGIIPRGTAEQTSSFNFENDCNTKHYGYGCAAWVIYNENMDYLHCDDLSWNGKIKCK